MERSSSNALVTTMDQWFAKAPALPSNVREVLVNIAPWIALIFGLIGVLGALGGLGLLTFFAPFAVFGGMDGVTSYGSGMIAAVFWLVSAVLLLAAFPGTKARKQSGWMLLFWSEIVSLVGALIAMSILSGIVSALIGFYILFQIRSYYK